MERTETVDGALLTLEGGYWGLIRPSGTEPLLRIYAEAANPELVTKLLDGAVAYLRV